VLGYFECILRYVVHVVEGLFDFDTLDSCTVQFMFVKVRG
jgi:hypothetical protein